MGTNRHRDELLGAWGATASKRTSSCWNGVVAALGLLCGTLGVSGCGGPEATELRVGINAWPAYELLYLAQERGFFRESGVPVKLVEFGCLSDSRRAYETGKVDVLATTIVEVLMARETAPRDLRIVRLFNVSSGGDAIVAGAATRSVSELRGKRIGVELASLGIYVLARALEKEGLTLADVKPVAMDQNAMREALFAGELEAVVTYPPESTAILRDAKFRVVFSTAQIPEEVVDVLAVDSGVLARRAAQVQALQQGLDRAFDFLSQHPEEACRIMAERERLSAEEFRRQLTEGMTLVAPAEQEKYLGAEGKLPAVIRRAAHCLRQNGLLSTRPEITDCMPSHE